MEYAFAKKEARRERYVMRAKTARFYARLVMFLLVCTTAVAFWQDDTYGPQMKDYARLALEKFEETTNEGSAGRKLVQTAMNKLQL